MKDWLTLKLAHVIWASGSIWGAQWAMQRLKRAGFTNQDLAHMPKY